MKTIEPWNLKHLQEALNRDLLSCRTETERSCCKAISGKFIRETAEKYALTRKLTPGELAIAESHGYNTLPPVQP